MAHLQARQIASYLSRFPIAAELPWSVGAQELVVLRCQDYNTFVKEGYVLRKVDGKEWYVRQRDFGKIAINSLELVMTEAAFFEKLTWHKAKFYGLELPNGANRPIKKDWSKEEREEIKYVAANLRIGTYSTIRPRPEAILLAAKHLNYAMRKKAAAEKAKLQGEEEVQVQVPRKDVGAPRIVIYGNPGNPYSDLPFGESSL